VASPRSLYFKMFFAARCVAIEDAEFRQLFVADETIAERWRV